VLDEADSIDDLLESIAVQTVLPDEVLIVDGGSRDDTWQRLQGWQSRLPVPLHLVQAPGVSIARGRNLAIQAAAHELIAVTDAGVRLEPTWLEHLLATCAADIDVVSGFFQPNPCTVFERAMGATVLPALADVDPESFLPSSRSVLFRREMWKTVTGYPEWLDYGEDLVFDLALKRAGARFAFAPGARVWFKPRGSFAAFFRQYYYYARGDGKADLWRRRHAIRWASYMLLGVLLWRRGPGLLLVLAGAAGYTRRPYARLLPLLRGLSTGQIAYALALVPVIRLVGDVAKMLGYPVGVWWRIRGK
jgi:glycosyltransferase involved in cell wall biosynthesis